MTAKILEFDREFNGTDMTCDEIRQQVRDRGWPGFHIDAMEYNHTGVLMIRRMSTKRAYGGLGP